MTTIMGPLGKEEGANLLLNKIARSVFCLYLFATVIDATGSGLISTIPGIGISVKYLLSAVLCLLFIARVITFLMGKGFPENHFRWNIVSLVSFSIFFVIVGLLRGNETGFVLKDALGFFYYLAAFVLFPFYEKNEDIFPLLKALFFSAILVSFVLISVEYLLVSGRISSIPVGLFLLESQLGFLTGIGEHFFRLHIRSGIFIQIAVAISYSLLAYKQEVKGVFRWTMLCAGLAALFITFSRGFWLGLLASAFLATLMLMRNANVKGMAVAFVLTLFAFSFFLGVSGASLGGVFGDRFFSSFNFTDNPSNLVRAWQFSELQEKALDHPVIGSGYGAYLESYSKDVEHPFLYELDYVSMVMKFGVGGFLVLCSIFFSILRKEYLFLALVRDRKIKAVATGIFVSQIGLLVTGATNPYMNGILGNLIVILGMVSFNTFMNDKGLERA